MAALPHSNVGIPTGPLASRPMGAALRELASAEIAHEAPRAGEILEELRLEREATSVRQRTRGRVFAAIGAAALLFLAAYVARPDAKWESVNLGVAIVTAAVALACGAAWYGFHRAARRAEFETEVVSKHSELKRRRL